MVDDDAIDMLVQLGALDLMRAMLLDALVLLRMVLHIPVAVFTAVLLAALVQLRVVLLRAVRLVPVVVVTVALLVALVLLRVALLVRVEANTEVLRVAKY